MASQPVPPRGLGRRGWLARSFALRLGVGFALVALVGASVTAVVVNTAFAARFDRYLAQQQAAELGRIATAISRAYTGQGRWDPTALATLVPTVGSGTVRVVTPAGQDVWHWDGHYRAAHPTHQHQRLGRSGIGVGLARPGLVSGWPGRRESAAGGPHAGPAGRCRADDHAATHDHHGRAGPGAAHPRPGGRHGGGHRPGPAASADRAAGRGRVPSPGDPPAAWGRRAGGAAVARAWDRLRAAGQPASPPGHRRRAGAGRRRPRGAAGPGRWKASVWGCWSRPARRSGRWTRRSAA